MKAILLIIISIVMISCNQGTSGDNGKTKEQTTEQNPAAVKTIQLSVSGMTCEGCENSVETALAKVDGVVSSEASHVKASTSISYDTTKVKRETLAETINGLGYQVENF